MHHLFIKLFIAEEFRPCIGKSRAFVQSLSVILIGAIAIFGEIAVSIDNGAKYFLAEHGIILGVTYKCIMNSADYGRWRERSSHWFTVLRFAQYLPTCKHIGFKFKYNELSCLHAQLFAFII